MVDWTPKLAERILQEVARGRSLSAVCREAWAPHRDTVYWHAARDDQFKKDLDIAYDQMGLRLMEECVEIADTTDDPKQARVQIEAREKLAKRVEGGRHTQKNQVELSGEVNQVSNLSDDQLGAMIEGLERKLAGDEEPSEA